MSNELILILTLLCTYSAVVLLYRFFGKTGLYMWTAVATIAANIEVAIIVDAFGMEQTLGNILFASTFLVTDILSETEGREYASKAVKLGITVSVIFIIITQSWFLYTPSPNDIMSPVIRSVFANTPRIMLAGIAVYGIVQVFDVWAYHAIWKHTTKIFGNSRSGLWIRNNGSTLMSQLLNTVLFTLAAFGGVYSTDVIIHLCVSSYIIYIVTSLLDTPAVYAARRLMDKGLVRED